MGRTSASHKVSRGDESRHAARPSSNGVYRRPSGANADGAPTIRNLVPWRDMEKKLAERLATKEAVSDVEAAPDSGVRTSAETAGLPPDLTYSVYTLEDLEARAQRAPRTSISLPPAYDPQHAPWPVAGRSALALLRLGWAWVQMPKPRPHVMDVCRVPLAAFLADLKVALRTVPWKRLALAGGVALGAIVLLLGLVLTAAELTDDLKPRRGRSYMTATVDAPETEDPAVMTSAPATKPAQSAPAPAPIEIDDVAPQAAVRSPASRSAAGAASAKKQGTAKKKAVEVFIP